MLQGHCRKCPISLIEEAFFCDVFELMSLNVSNVCKHLAHVRKRLECLQTFGACQKTSHNVCECLHAFE